MTLLQSRDMCPKGYDITCLELSYTLNRLVIMSLLVCGRLAWNAVTGLLQG